MKLVLKKNEENVWRIIRAKEPTVSPAKFAATPSVALNPPTPTRASPNQVERPQPPCWAEPR